MKKRIMFGIAMAFICILLTNIVCFAQTTPFYYEKDKSFEDAVNSLNSTILNRVAVQALSNSEITAIPDGVNLLEWLTPKRSKEAEKDVTYSTEKVYCLRYWEPKNVVEFMKAADKKAVLDTVPIEAYLFPAFYKGERMEKLLVGVDRNFQSVLCYKQEWHWSIADKDKIEAELTELGFGEYELLTTATAMGYRLALTQKDGQDFCILLSRLQQDYSSITETLVEQNAALFEKKALTADEMEKLSNDYYALAAKYKQEHQEEIDGGATGGGADIKDVRIEPIWFVIGGAALLIAAAVAIALLTKKKAK